MPTAREQDYINHNLNLIQRYIKAFQGPGMNKISEITTHILISNLEIALNLSLLKDYNIDAVIYIGSKIKDAHILNNYKKKKIDYIPVNIYETKKKLPNLIPYLNSVYDLIHKYIMDERKILIHCDTGLSLSVSFLLFYLLKRYYLTNFKTNKEKTLELINTEISFLPNVVRFLKEMRPCIEPQPEYIYQLLISEYEMKLYFQESLLLEVKNYNKTIAPIDPDSDSEVYPDETSAPDVEKYLDYLESEKTVKPVIKSTPKIKEKYDKLEDLLGYNKFD